MNSVEDISLVVKASLKRALMHKGDVEFLQLIEDVKLTLLMCIEGININWLQLIKVWFAMNDFCVWLQSYLLYKHVYL